MLTSLVAQHEIYPYYAPSADATISYQISRDEKSITFYSIHCYSHSKKNLVEQHLKNRGR
jgi:hypothetical protein